ncbi:hypothetical protein HaLaN_21713 [Haematococcus lacustris]|uniref:Uncharacterized protein n=1 Tax=Haematococcus lacustris TaxID=44745 RepID=A0A699ZMV2_HAELA|nr:hypothetical protein HaLaN_21713 [Haematococcus lacustris]
MGAGNVEVLQDQIVGVELSNEALKAERELLLAEVDRLKLEHEKGQLYGFDRAKPSGISLLHISRFGGVV